MKIIKNKEIIIFLIILSFAYINVYSESNKSVIENISVYGNINTKKSVIKKNIILKENQVFEVGNIRKSKNSLLKLGIFEKVEIETKNGKNGVIIVIIVKEKPFLYFNTLLSFNNENSDYYSEKSEKDSIGIGIGINDFSGKRRMLLVSASVGGLNKIGLFYKKGYSFNFFWGIKLTNLWYNSSIYDSDIETFSGKIFLGQHIKNILTNMWFSYDYLKTDSKFLLNESSKFFRMGVDITYNSKDWELFPTKGLVAKLGAYRVLNQNKKWVYNRYMLNLSTYFKF